jgi:uncharacterized protein YcfL
MPRLTLLSVALTALFVFGCQTNTAPSPGLGDPYPAPINDPQISVLSPDLRPWLGFHPTVIADDGERPMRIEVPVRNMTNNQYLVDYRVLFYDAHGMELTPTMGWQMIAMEPKQVVRLRGTALSTDAANYRLEVRWAR